MLLGNMPNYTYIPRSEDRKRLVGNLLAALSDQTSQLN